MSLCFGSRLSEIAGKENVEVTLHLQNGEKRFFSFAGYLFGRDHFMNTLSHFEKKVFPQIIKEIETDGEHLISF
jgi:hypothetical protein